MTNIIALAKKAGFTALSAGILEDALERFSELIRADERELCAKVCDEVKATADKNKDSPWLTANGKAIHEGMYGGALGCAAAIRARKP